MANQTVIKQVQGALEYEPRINLHRHPIAIDVVDRSVVLEGDVDGLAAKKLALQLARAVDGVDIVVDRLRIPPAEHRGDGAIRDTICEFLLRESELLNCTIRIRRRGIIETVRNILDDSSGQ